MTTPRRRPGRWFVVGGLTTFIIEAAVVVAGAIVAWTLAAVLLALI